MSLRLIYEVLLYLVYTLLVNRRHHLFSQIIYTLHIHGILLNNTRVRNRNAGQGWVLVWHVWSVYYSDSSTSASRISIFFLENYCISWKIAAYYITAVYTSFLNARFLISVLPCQVHSPPPRRHARATPAPRVALHFCCCISAGYR